MGRAIAQIAEFQVPDEPKTTFNVGVIQGGTSVNTISGSASMLVDLRSDSEDELDRLDEELHKVIEQAAQEENARWDASKPQIKVQIEERCETGGGTAKGLCDRESSIPAAELLGVEPEYRYESSTDANIPISMGIPAITVGRGGEEDGIHTLQEWYEPKEAWLGPQRDLLLMILLAGAEGVCEPVIEKR